METFFGSLTGALQKRYGQGVTAEFNDFIQQVRTKYLSNATNPNKLIAMPSIRYLGIKGKKVFSAIFNFIFLSEAEK